jgi:phosphate-selective porin OprO/OprP
VAQQGSDPQSFEDLRARLEQQDQQIQELRAQVQGIQQGTPATEASYAPPAAPAGDAAQGLAVGSDLGVKTNFKNGNGLYFETPGKDFTTHIGGWIQWDNVWWNESKGMNVAPNTTKTQTVQGAAADGIGPLADGDYFRRVRLVTEGTLWEVGEYRWNIALENIQYSTVGLDEMWIGINRIPAIGTIRVGHIKTPMGLEADMTGSSRAMTFMERSSYSEAIELNQNFGTGVLLTNTYLDERGTWSVMGFRPDNGNSGDYFGSSQCGVQGRITALPFFEDEGRHLLHVGISGGWRDNSPGGTVQLRARPELRDDDPAAQTVQPLPNANDNRMIDTGKISCTNEYLLGLETLYIRGPWSLQAEYGWNYLDQAQITVGTPKPVSSYVFNGGYLQVAYTLTGEARSYDRRSGSLGRYYLGGQGPYEMANLIREDDGRLVGGWGGWELACRVSYTDLNSGTGAAFVDGGMMRGVSVGLNWYLNTNLTVNTEWVYNYRYDLPGGNGNPGVTTTVGDTSGFGTRVQLSF